MGIWSMSIHECHEVRGKKQTKDGQVYQESVLRGRNFASIKSKGNSIWTPFTYRDHHAVWLS